MPFQADFDLDIPKAIYEQLLSRFEGLEPEPLTNALIGGPLAVVRAPGVYGLHLDDDLVYVGKADDLGKRIEQHRTKISGRQNISLDRVRFKAVLVHRNWNAYAPESILLRHYRSRDMCDWNGSGFGPHDPGRNREKTDMPPEHFDARFPIRADWPCTWITAGEHSVLDTLVTMKEKLPFLLRYETPGRSHYKRGHPDFNNRTVKVPNAGLPARDLLALVVAQLPGWQATEFPSHIIAYKECEEYAYGIVIARNTEGG